MSEILLHGSRVTSEKIIKAGYKFKYSDLESSLLDLLKKIVNEDLVFTPKIS